MNARAVPRIAPVIAPAAYACTITASEALAVTVNPVAGAICDAVVLLVLVTVYALGEEDAPPAWPMLLSLVALASLIGIALPVHGISQITRDALVAALVLLSLWLAGRSLHLDRGPLRLRLADLPAQVLIALCGIPLGLAGWWILGPAPRASTSTPGTYVLAALVLGALVAPSLELLFRWALQPELQGLYGTAGLVLLNVLFAAGYLGTHSPGFVIMIGAAGLGASLAVRRTGTVWGAVAAHGLLAVGMLLVWPAVLG